MLNSTIKLPSLAFATLLALGVNAWAGGVEDVIKGVYLGSEDLCKQAKTDGLPKLLGDGNMMLSKKGLEGTDYKCEFIQSTKATQSAAWAVTAICQTAGTTFPDLLSIVETSANQLDVASVLPGDEDNPGNSGNYFLCDGVTAPNP